MFSTLKDKLLAVQDGITAGLKGFSNGIPEVVARPGSFDAGCEALNTFQTAWRDIHELNDANAASAKEVDAVIRKLHKKILEEHQCLCRLNAQLEDAKTLTEGLENIVIKIGEMREEIEEIEKGLIDLEDAIEIAELRQRIDNSNYQFSVYREKKLMDLETFKVDLSEKYKKKLLSKEAKVEKVQKAKQIVYDEMFKTDMDAYKKTGQLPAKRPEPPPESNPSLDDIDLDVDTSELENYLDT